MPEARLSHYTGGSHRRLLRYAEFDELDMFGGRGQTPMQRAKRSKRG